MKRDVTRVWLFKIAIELKLRQNEVVQDVYQSNTFCCHSLESNHQPIITISTNHVLLTAIVPMCEAWAVPGSVSVIKLFAVQMFDAR